MLYIYMPAEFDQLSEWRITESDSLHFSDYWNHCLLFFSYPFASKINRFKNGALALIYEKIATKIIK